MVRFLAYLRLVRPANLPTAAADVLAGFTLGLFLTNAYTLTEGVELALGKLLLLIGASVLLYAGGVALNDVCDAEIDFLERPERPIPSGIIKKKTAGVFAGFLLCSAIPLAYMASVSSAILSLFLAGSIILYDCRAKSHDFFGPLVMGICRGLNLLLGLSFFGWNPFVGIAVIPIIYIFSVTLVSRGEVHAGNKKQLIYALILFIIAWILVFSFSVLYWKVYSYNLLLWCLWGVVILRAYILAYRENSPANIKRAVISGVLGIVLMDAVWVASTDSVYLTIITLLLLPLSLILSRLFAVT